MFNSTLIDFDLGLFGTHNTTLEHSFNEPDATCNNNTFAQHMEEDKKMTLTLDPNTQWLEATSDLQDFMDIGALPEPEDNVNVDALINDVEDFLKQHEAPTQPIVEMNVGSKGNVDPLAAAIDATFSQEEMSAAEELLDELLKSDVDINLDSLDVQTNDAKEPEKEIDQENEFKIKSQDDSGFFEMSNVTQVITEDGRQIVIMIAPPSPDSSTKVDEDDTTSYIAPESLATVDEDSEWCPDSPTSSRGRPAVKRSATKKQKRTAPYITDKKERKKQQNVEAARRYRDKKKAEQCDVDVEEQVLINRNKELKSKVSELEAEMKTMKKLMKELGILK